MSQQISRGDGGRDPSAKSDLSGGPQGNSPSDLDLSSTSAEWLPPEASSPPPTTTRRGGRLYFIATGMAQVFALLRYVVLARLLGPTELGLASTLVVTGSFFDMISDTGSDKFLIQDRRGDEPEVQKLVQLVYIARGALIAAALLILAIPIAHFYGAPRLAGGLMVFALGPFIVGFLHLDLRRQQRAQDFRPESLTMMVAETVSLAVTAAAAFILRDFTAILYGLIARSLAMVAVSHMTARRKYGLAFDRELGLRLWHYSAPLMLNGLLLYLGSQGDRVTIGRFLSFRDLGQYSAVLLLVFYPSGMIQRYLSYIFMPFIAAPRDDPAERNRRSDRLGGMIFVMAIAMAIGFSIIAPPVVTLLFGAKYRTPALLVGLIGVLQTTRFLMTWPSTVALSMGKSRTVLLTSFPRILIFPGALAGLWLIGGLTGVVAGFAAGEVAAIAVALVLLNRITERPWTAAFDRLGLFLAVAGLIAGWNVAIYNRAISAEIALALASVGVLLWLWRRERETIVDGATLFRVQAKRIGMLLHRV